jgi:5-methylcytosine-specific restriction endonuclease McrBC regulatory subunit McrC
MIDGNGLWVTSSLIICLFPNIVIYTFIYKVKQAYIRGLKKKYFFIKNDEGTSNRKIRIHTRMRMSLR